MMHLLHMMHPYCCTRVAQLFSLPTTNHGLRKKRQIIICWCWCLVEVEDEDDHQSLNSFTRSATMGMYGNCSPGTTVEIRTALASDELNENEIFCPAWLPDKWRCIRSSRCEVSRTARTKARCRKTHRSRSKTRGAQEEQNEVVVSQDDNTQEGQDDIVQQKDGALSVERTCWANGTSTSFYRYGIDCFR